MDDMNTMDETSSLQPPYLDTLEINATDLSALARRQFAKSLSRIRNLRFKCFLAVKSEWDIILLASQTLTTLDLTRWHSECKFHLGIVLQL